MNEQILQQLKQNRTQIRELQSQMVYNLFDDQTLDDATGNALLNIVDDCIQKVKGLIKKARTSDVRLDKESLEYVEYCLIQGDNKTAITILKNLSKRGNIAAQLKLGILCCFGIKASSGVVEFENVAYGKQVLSHLTSKGNADAAYQLGCFFKGVGDMDESINFFEKAYDLGEQKAYPELMVLYRTIMLNISDVRQRLVLSQKINNLKSELLIN